MSSVPSQNSSRDAFCPGRYAALDVGSNSVLLLVADVDADERLTPVLEQQRITRLAEGFYGTRRLGAGPRARTLETVREFALSARETGADATVAVGTSVLREAENGTDFVAELRRECGVEVEVINGRREAGLAYTGNRRDRRLPPTDDERIVIDVGGGSSEVVRGYGPYPRSPASYCLGAVRLRERCIKGDPPTAMELAAAEEMVESGLADVEPAAPGALVLGSGGTIFALASVARAGGMIHAPAIHAASLPHRVVAELVDLFRTLPLSFLRRVPGLEPGRADIILPGAMIVHQLMARLSAPRLVVTTNGVRHGCIYEAARRAALLRR